MFIQCVRPTAYLRHERHNGDRQTERLQAYTNVSIYILFHHSEQRLNRAILIGSGAFGYNLTSVKDCVVTYYLISDGKGNF